MRQLMSHTAGFGYGLCCEDPVNTAFRDTGVLARAEPRRDDETIEAIPLLYDPGTQWSYSAAVDIQGYIVQKLSGQKFGDYLKEQHLHAARHERHVLLRHRRQQAALRRRLSLGQGQANALVKNEDRPDRPGFTDPNRLESGGGGLVSSTHDYARFAQMFLNKGALGGNTVLKPETVELMRTNAIGDARRLDSTAPTANPGLPGVGFGLDFAIYDEPSVTGQPYAKGTHYWGGAAGTWFWIDPANDLFFVGMIQQMGGFRPDAMNFRNDVREARLRSPEARHGRCNRCAGRSRRKSLRTNDGNASGRRWDHGPNAASFFPSTSDKTTT